jgi:DNA-binding XRE family transcriptional regulator/predicted GIY-YIG superfamily endonuclease
MAVATKSYTVYRLYDAERNLLYIGCTNDFEQRMRGHRYQSAWYPSVAEAQTEHFERHEEAMIEEQTQIATLAPRHNRKALRYARFVAELVDGQKLQELRLAALMTQRELGSAANVAPETINRIENADEPRRTAAITVRKLARALDVTPADLLED